VICIYQTFLDNGAPDISESPTDNLGNWQGAISDRVIAIGSSVSDSVIVTGDNDQVILLKKEATIALEQILQQWQPKQDRYFKPKVCQKRRERDRYLQSVLQRLEQLDNSEILKDERVVR